MTLEPVDSSHLKAVGYDAATSTLEVQFQSGARFRYEGVPMRVHRSLMGAPSLGAFFARNIKKRYPFKQTQSGG